jgi:EAL domain-containing protein (putative c-di-GMP-specific phosphodiesterase class I)
VARPGASRHGAHAGGAPGPRRQLSIDDYGAGWSQLSLLRQLALVDELKIAPGFVAGLGAEPASLAVVQAVVGTAHALDLRVCAKHVETGTQLSVLRGLRCDAAQGFLLSPPVTAAEVAELARERRAGPAGVLPAWA